MEINRLKVKGTVKCFDCSKGFGFITPDYDGDDLIFNHSSIKSESFSSLYEGMVVEFVVIEDDDGRIRAIDITGLSDCPWKDEFQTGAEERNWVDLPRDVLLLIFKKITAVWIIRPVFFFFGNRCSLLISLIMWHVTSDMANLQAVAAAVVLSGSLGAHRHTDLLSLLSMEPMGMEAVDRSRGRLEEFYAESFGNDALMRYITDRTTRLRRLRLISTYLISEEGLVRAVSRCSQLEALEISLCSFSSELVALLGQACPQLKSFELVQTPWKLLRRPDNQRDLQALAIANHMRQLRRLQLHGNTLTAIGLRAILDNRPHLEHLDLRQCFELCLDENLKERFGFFNDSYAANSATIFDYEENGYY